MQLVRRPQVRVRVHEAGDDRLAGDVDDPCVVRHGHLAAGPDGRDAVVADDDVGVVDDFVALHGHDARAAKHRDALRDIALRRDANAEFHGVVRRRRPR